MKLQRTVVLTLLILFVQSASVLAQGSTDADKCFAKGGVYDETKKTCTIEGGYSIKIDYPLSLTENSAFVEKLVDKFLTDTRQGFIKQYTDVNKDNPDFRPWALEITYKTDDPFSKDILTLRFLTYEYTGGAHGLSIVSSYILDLANNKEITFNDLFVANSKPLEKLAPLAAAALAQQLGPDADPKWISDGTAPKAENYTAYALTGKGLVLIFQQYQVAPYAAGIQEVTVPFSQLQGVLKPEYIK